MFPSAECEALAAACAHKLNATDAAARASNRSQQERQGAAESNSKSHNRAHHPGPRQRRAPAAAASPSDPRFTYPHSSSAAGATAAAAAAAHTPEQARLCEVILRETCYYKTLGVSRDASEEVIRKAYRRVSLRF